MDKKLVSSWREHPHLSFHVTGKIEEPDCPYAWTRPMQFDVNTQEDFERAEMIYNHFGNNEFSTRELLEYYD
jgi:spore coat polysaccharide biosynthesis protein SpsF (cytidylyltransferase family)